MTNKTPQELIKKINEAIQTRNPKIIKDFLEEFTMEIVEAQKPEYEKMLIGAAEQGILNERERCISIIEENCTSPDLKAKLLPLIRGETNTPQL